MFPALAERLRGGRTITFPEYVELALYDPDDGFYATGGRAGRRGDFLTSPEVGPLFGALLARVCDEVWEDLGRPDPFVVADVGAGPGTLARSIRLAAPRCTVALVYVLVERSASQRDLHADHLPGWAGELESAALDELALTPLDGAGPVFVSSSVLPNQLTGLIVANELLDNLPFDIVRRTSIGAECLDVMAVEDDLDLVVVPAPGPIAAELATLAAPEQTWLPWQIGARASIADWLARLQRGRLVVIDYGAPTPELAQRPDLGWIRTFRANGRGEHPLEGPGTQDITADVAVDQIQLGHPATRVRSQAEFLHDLGIDELVAEGREVWAAHAHAPDLAALRARSRVGEAEALTEPDGLGGFVVLEWDVALDP